VKERFRRSPHSVYEIKYHFVWIPKYRHDVLKGEIGERIKCMVSEICEGMDILIIEGKICRDHVHMCVSVPPRYSPAQVMKKIKGATSERIFREYPELREKYWGQHFWSRGYFVSTVGIDEETIRKYIRNQDRVHSPERQIKLWK
jgi:putative transposase